MMRLLGQAKTAEVCPEFVHDLASRSGQTRVRFRASAILAGETPMPAVAPGRILGVPTISRFIGIVIAMFSTITGRRISMPVMRKGARRFGSTRWR